MKLKIYTLIFFMYSIVFYGQFFSSPATIDGNIDTNYATGTDGWAVGWDNTYLYLRKTTTGNQPVIVYLDINPIVPVSGGANSNGSLTGVLHWGITPTLPFRSDFMIYWEDSFLQYQTANGSGGWNSSVTIGTPERTNGNADKECRILWSTITGSGRPSALNWLGYCNSRSTPGFIFHQVPAANLNPSGSIASPRFFGYYSVVNTTNSGTTNPFAANQISFETRGSYTFGASQPSVLWDMTNNAPSGTEDLIMERDLEIRNRLDIATPSSRFRANAGNRTITMSGTSGSLRNIGGTMFGEFGGNTNSLIVSGTVELFSSGNFIDFRNYTINSGAVLIANNVQMSSNSGSGSFTVNGTLRTTRSNGLFGANDFTIRSNNLGLTLGSSSTVEYNALGSQTITSSTNYANLIVSGSGTKTPNGNISVTGDLTLNSGTLDLGTFTANRSTSGGTFTLGASTTLNITGTNSLPSNYTTHAFNTASTVNYAGTNQTVATLSGSAAYGNVILSGSGNKELGGNVSIANDLTVQSGVAFTVASGQNLTVADQLNNAGGTITIQNNANLIQNGTTNDNVGDVNVFRNSASLFKLDYTLWSSPVAGQNLLAFSPATLPNRFYTYNSGTNNYSPIVPSTNDFEEGIGYLIRMPDNHPTATATIWNGSFDGVPNNGNVSVSVANDTYNAVGNPYPSTIDADDFINANSLTEALYFWRKTNGASGSAYATYTLAGGVGTDSSDSSSQIPNGIIQVGQGFIVKSTSTTINFDNTMRIGDNGNQFFRNSSEIENNRIRLTATGANGFYSQILVNYRSEATNDFDAALDGRYINDSDNAFYTILNQEPLVIQARALPFENTDVVSLGFKTNTAGTFSIVLNQKDGVFADNSEIFIKDNLMGIWHNITESPYEFVSEAGAFSERFELVYQETLSVNEALVNANNFIVVKENNGLTIRSAQEEIATVYVYDLSGRLLASSTNNLSTSVVIPLENTQTQVLLLQVITQKGITATKKVVH